jgi:hypothetical protein
MKTQANNNQTINSTTATDPTQRIGLVRRGMTVAFMAPPRRSIDGFGRGAPGYHPTPHHRRADRNHSH